MICPYCDEECEIEEVGGKLEDEREWKALCYVCKMCDEHYADSDQMNEILAQINDEKD